MLGKSARIAAATVLALSLCACSVNVESKPSSGAQASSESAQSSEAGQAKESEKKSDSKVDKIDLSIKNGSIRYNRVERATAELTEAENALVFVFDFTGGSDDPIWPRSAFIIEFYQNGVQLTDNPTYFSGGGEQYELVHAASSGVMKGGNVAFGQIVVPKDNSPITVVVKGNGTMEKDQQMMEVPIDNIA